MEYIGIHCAVLLVSFSRVVTQDNFMKPIFNAMTPYFWVKNADKMFLANEDGIFRHGGDSCHITSLNYLFRHAARYPSLHWIEKMNKLHMMLKLESSVRSKNPFIADWRNPFPVSKEYSQTTVGDTEMIQLGKRFGKRFRNLFNGYYDNVNFAVTSKLRTVQSYKKFYEGFINSHTFSPKNTQMILSTHSSRLRYYEFCKKYTDDVDHNDQSRIEFLKFLNGSEMNFVASKVKQKLGVIDMTTDNVLTIQQICAFELGMFNKSGWCQLFDMEDLLVIDYLIDIRNYWKMGYGYDINWQVSCPFTSYMFTTFDRAINGEPEIDIQFAHTDTILPLYTAFGLFNDSNKLLAENYNKQTNRMFRTSLIAPFSASLGIGLYQCNTSMEFMVKMFVNEESVVIPACERNICSYASFKNYYGKLSNCNFKKICEGSSSSSFRFRPNGLTVAFIGILTIQLYSIT